MLFYLALTLVAGLPVFFSIWVATIFFTTCNEKERYFQSQRDEKYKNIVKIARNRKRAES